MAIIAIVRVSKMHGHVAIDIPYEMFWQHLEAAVAILMASLTAYRTFFIRYRERQRHDERLRKGPSYTFRTWRRKVMKKEILQEDGALPQIPRPTMTGLFTFIRHNNRTTEMDQTEVGSTISKEHLTVQTYGSDRDDDLKSEGVALSPITNHSVSDQSDIRTDQERTAVGTVRTGQQSTMRTYTSDQTW